MSICGRCNSRTERPCAYADTTAEYYAALISALRHVAYRYGYALATHGSLKSDIDLLAVPWRDTAVSAESLAEAIRKTAEAITGTARVRVADKKLFPELKPCGRLAWAFYLTPYDSVAGPYIDLSVMPKEQSGKRRKP